MRRRPFLFIAAGLLAIAIAVPVAQAARNRGPQSSAQQHVAALVALGTGITYQGRLTDGGGPANAVYDLRFILYDADSGGTQVGATIEKADLAVQNGLFTTELDFGAAAYDGNARWLEIAVRPGASSGTYTVLSPRQPITPVPYALYAKNVGPHNHLGQTWNGANATSLKIENTTVGGSNGLVVDLQGTDGVAVAGYALGDTGTPVGVNGFAESPDGVGGSFGNSNAAGTALKAAGAGANSTALEISNGAIKVSGTAPAAFIWEVTNASICPVALTYCTNIDNPATNGKPNALLFVTPNVVPNGTANDRVIAVNYVSGKWQIYNQDGTPLAIGDAFNVLVINR